MKKIILVVFAILLVCLAGAAWYTYDSIFGTNVGGVEPYSLYITKDTDFDDLVSTLEGEGLLNDVAAFRMVAKQMNYIDNLHPGHYVVEPGESNRSLLVKLRGGIQVPVRVVVSTVRTKAEFASKVSEQVHFSEADLMERMQDQTLLERNGLNNENVLCRILPNTYEMYWTVSPQAFLQRMFDEYEYFWNGNRLKRAADHDLSPDEVYILASIVEKEMKHQDEAAKIAGVYLNRLRIGMKLDADPTLIFGIGDFSIRRVLDVHKELDSPYNTYKFGGLPPGPICMPSIKTIDAVLHAKVHKYLYFCASADFNGYHHFSETYRQHRKYAKRYHAELNKRKIFN